MTIHTLIHPLIILFAQRRQRRNETIHPPVILSETIHPLVILSERVREASRREESKCLKNPHL